ncbi:cytochrome P450 [Ganoderma sinense ZZ0214-1]|uniref:Cytochrome P450 n=1 Tax=Ganoderma sinense ZZ0214-1 TaxID=1077348 RepID=A0A2G8RMF5_9APHY|nr:cytochrome P450 [Ganoderma sinense ZZ0214-1]
MPTTRQWLGLAALCKEYGDIIHLRTPGKDFIVLGSAAAVSEVLEKRTANSSDRLIGPIVELSGSDWALGLLPYGQRWRDYRRALWQHFHPGAIVKYRPAQESFAPLFLKKLLDKPEGYMDHIRFVFSATLLKIVYGIDIDDDDLEIVRNIREAVEGISECFVPGKFIVDYIPILRYIPEWFPGAGFQKKCVIWRMKQEILKNVPFEQRNTSLCKSEYVMASCTTVVDQLLAGVTKRDELDDAPYWDELVKSIAAVVYEGERAIQSVATMQSTLLAMSLYPEVQQKAQAELDRVVGPGCLPNFADLDSLVYIRAIVKESIRWHTVTPLGIPHRTVEDDFFRGYFVPAGSVIIANSWACMRDPNVYKDPEEFCPDRFIRDGRLDPDVLDPATIIFGSGRRQSMLFLSVASTLHVFNISAPLDNDGNAIRIEPCMSDGALSYLEDCRCTVKLRSPEAAALVEREIAAMRYPPCS